MSSEQVLKSVPSVDYAQKTKEQQFEDLFASLIEKNYITKDVKVGDMVLTIKPLETSEYLEAETVYVATVNTVPRDVVNRVRTVSTLSYAVVSINGIAVADADKDTERDLRLKVYNLLLKLPPLVIDKIHMEYRDLVEEQVTLFENIGEHAENF